MSRLQILKRIVAFAQQNRRALVCVLVLAFSLAPTSIDFSRNLLALGLHPKGDFTDGYMHVPVEEIFAGLQTDPDSDVVRHALRIIEQHYVQKEKLRLGKMLEAGLRSVARDFGGDLQVVFLQNDPALAQALMSQRTVRLCPAAQHPQAELCSDPALVTSLARQGLASSVALVRVGLRVFSVPMSNDGSLRALDLVGRFILAEYARFKRQPLSQVTHSYLNGLLDELDPHSSYMTQEEYRELRSGTRGQFGGVGIVIDESQELPVIREVVPNSPAHMAGVRPGDVLLKVGQRLCAFHPLDTVLRTIRELSVDSATPVWFYRPMSRRVYRAFLAREEIPTRSAELRTVAGRPDVLHVRVTGFSNHTAEDVYSLYESAQLLARGRLRLFVLDLRGNPGGLLDQAIQLSDLFLKSGQIVSTRSRYEEQIEQATRGVKIDLPVVVLMNSSSASASEIVAGALKDHGRALLVGERTFGKGSVQSLFELSTGTALKLTVAHYFTPRGRSLQGIGVEPHVNIKLVQPRDGYLWMSGSSEIDREEHLTSHLSNPTKGKMSLLDAFSHLSTTMWAYLRPEGNVIDALRPIHFAYPLGDNTQALLRLEDDPVARVGINLGTLLYGNRTSSFVFSERQLKDAHRKISDNEVQYFREAYDSFDKSPGLSVFRSFFDSLGMDEKAAPALGRSRMNLSWSNGDVLVGRREALSNIGGLRDFLSWFGIANPAESKGSQAPTGRVSMSAKSIFAWPSDLQLMLSVAANDLKAGGKSALPSALLGLRLDDLHDGPTVWLPARFVRASDGLLVASVVLPKAVRTYLSGVGTMGYQPTVVGQVKWRLRDDGLNLGTLHIPPLARRHGKLEGHLIARGGQNFLQIQFSRASDVLAEGQGGGGSAASALRGFEVLIAPLMDSRLKVVSDVVPLQRLSEGQYIGETELKLSPVMQSGLGFAGIVGGVVRTASGDVLASAPLLWVNDEGVFPMRTQDELRDIPLVPW
ncbi:MAG: S41 family peptidase [Betaproteobacteria bacterium]|nr:S41 family peptidase [Betaproteobacteria bacterium]